MKKKNIKKIVITTAIIVVITVVAIYSVVTYTAPPYYELSSRVDNVVEEEAIGWIRVQGTNIDYPVISSYEEDVDEKVEDFAWINNLAKEDGLYDRNLIYGHNILNLSATPKITDSNHTRFEQLMSFVYFDFAEENQFIQYSDKENDYLFEIYSISIYDKYDLNYNMDMTTSEKEEYINKSIEESIYDYNLIPDPTSQLITLSTCTRMMGNNGIYQFKIEGVLLEGKSSKKSITKTENYDIIEEKIKNEEVITDEI